MVDMDLAEKANEILKVESLNGKYQVAIKYLPGSKLFDKVKGKVIYVGCGVELSPLFLFENASTYIHQDLADRNLTHALRILEKNKIITDLRKAYDRGSRRTLRFRYKSMPKTLIEIHGKESQGEPFGSEGDVAFNVPKDVKKNLEAVYFFGTPYPHTIRCIQINLLPHLMTRGLFVGPYPYANGQFEGADPELLGLSRQEDTFVKNQSISKRDIESIIGYSIADYKMYLRHQRTMGYQIDPNFR